ncbi:MAG: peptidoglycan DD-metalloendopeptidase family protein [candidate division WOR-3 bacterium]|uniref:M23ase beta-sheet core domain-containing protein n=1 Tax=candidate division WOR-3 bacterium TaxID=2052148 RepID=A0A7C1SGA2_UNCW3|nr:peptidoglycan DD-metalloendopeptidase family protein [candidate division WOR-3 bacterium]
MTHKTLLFVVLSYTMLLSQPPVLIDSLDLIQQQLDSTQQKLKEIEQILSEIGMREHQTLQRLELLQEKIALTENLLKQIEYRVNSYNREISKLNAELICLMEQQDKLENRLKRRLVVIYKYSKLYRLQSLLTSKNLPEYYRKLINLRVISRADQQLIEETRKLNAEIRGKESAIQEALATQERLKNEVELKKQELLKDREQEMLILLQIRREKSAREALQTELASAAKQLRNLISQLQVRITETSSENLEMKRGKLPWPVAGDVVASFGVQIHPRYRTKINNLGIDIKVDRPSPVEVIATGKVAYADRFIGYGNLVIVDHGTGYFSLYGNLTSINTVVNATVTAGTVIGTVNDYLHFEIRKDGQPLNPKDWLQ